MKKKLSALKNEIVLRFPRKKKTKWPHSLSLLLSPKPKLHSDEKLKKKIKRSHQSFCSPQHTHSLFCLSLRCNSKECCIFSRLPPFFLLFFCPCSFYCFCLEKKKTSPCVAFLKKKLGLFFFPTHNSLPTFKIFFPKQKQK